MKEYN
jgi:hypothetical protein